MSRLKNITSSSISIQMFRTSTPVINYVDQKVVLTLKPGEDVDASLWTVSDSGDTSYNQDIVDGYINSGILTRIP